MDLKNKIIQRFDWIYKSNYSQSIIDELIVRIEQVKSQVKSKGDKWTEKDIVLICYGDSILKKDEPGLQTLRGFINAYLKDAISFVHILPFFPYSSDDGFSVIDYMQVNPQLGDWKDIESLSQGYKLMFDLVINHISQHSQWFKAYLKEEMPEKGYFIEVDPDINLSAVVRPRSLPLLSPYKTNSGEKHVWTTFSADQIDLNFSNPELMQRMVEVFLFYLEKGARMIRLDAIAFLWKEIGTNCLHLPETHQFVKLLRDITDYISSDLILLTETNVPNKENLSYFGNNDEANMVYQFSLPPLLLNTMFSENAEYLTKWAQTIPELTSENTFFNFTASHDGIGVRPLEGLLPIDIFNELIEGMKKFGGKISTKRNSDGSDSPYEINITYYDAMMGTRQGVDEFQLKRFLCSQTIMMTLKGMPAFYIHSLLGTQNYYEGVEETGMNRTINRRKWKLEEIGPLLESESHHSIVLNKLVRLIKIRKKQAAFHPNSAQKILDIKSSLFVVSRAKGELISVSNISTSEQNVALGELKLSGQKELRDLISGKKYGSEERLITLSPYQTIWLLR